MNLEMIPIEIIGLKTDLNPVVQTLRQVGSVHIDDLADIPDINARPLVLNPEMLRQQEELNYLLTRIGGLLEALGKGNESIERVSEIYHDEARQVVDMLMAKVQELTTRKEELEAEFSSLPRYEKTLRKLLPVIPSSARLPGTRTVGVLVNREHTGILDVVGRKVLDLSGGRAEIVASDIDTSIRAMLLVFPEEYSDEVENLLGREDISRLRLPSELGEGSPDVILVTLQRRMSSIPAEIQKLDGELTILSDTWSGKLASWQAALAEEIDSSRVLPQFGETDMTFVLAGWVPAGDFERLEMTLKKDIGENIYIEKIPMTPELEKLVPVRLQNAKIVKPFESLTKLLSLPRNNHIDPSGLMALFLPVFFGMILGDIGYGFLGLLLSLGLLRRYKSGIIHDILIVLAMGTSWAIVFGILYGEVFGTLGERLGLHPIWIDRTSPDQVMNLLLMTLGVGAVHITLGLLLGVWEAIKDKSRNHLFERGGMLIGLIGLFMLVGVLTDFLPQGFMNPAIAGLIVGIVLLGFSIGCLGIVMGPIEFIGLIGNLLSYLRIAAIGLASVYLAKVANEMAGMTASLVVGAIIAVLIHALNLILGLFSPTIHSLRLHYVEFFRKFYEGGGRAYQPFGNNYRE